MKTNVTRRTVIKSSTALATAGALTGPALLEWANAWPQTAPWKPEKGAQLSLLRAKSFVPAEDDACVAVMNAFTKATGVKVNIIRESDDDVQPKALVAANAGAGPDLFWGLFSLPHLFPQKCLDVSDVADYLGKRYGGWVASAIPYGKGKGDKWIDLPIVWVGNVMNYRKSSLKQAGFSRVPATTEELLEYAKATKKNNRPGGFALGRSPQDGNSWVHWCLWAHGGYAVGRPKPNTLRRTPQTAPRGRHAEGRRLRAVDGRGRRPIRNTTADPNQGTGLAGRAALYRIEMWRCGPPWSTARPRGHRDHPDRKNQDQGLRSSRKSSTSGRPAISPSSAAREGSRSPRIHSDLFSRGVLVRNPHTASARSAPIRAAHNGASEAELNAIFGWTGGNMATLYIKEANRARLAKAAMSKLRETTSEQTISPRGWR